MTVSPLDSLSQDLVLHILDSRDDDDPGGYSMLQLQEVARLGACSRALRSIVGVWATTPSAYGGAFRRWVEEEADPLAAWTGGAPGRAAAQALAAADQPGARRLSERANQRTQAEHGSQRN